MDGLSRCRVATVLAILTFSVTLPTIKAFSWRLYAGREECVTEYIPDNQWSYMQKHSQNPENDKVLVDLGFLVTSTYGTEDENAAVDFAIYAPDGRVVKSQDRVSGTEFGMEAHGGRGPWRACFRVSSGAVLRPSVILKLTYFIVNNDDILGDNFDWQHGGDSGRVNPEHLGTKEQIASLEHGLLRLDHYFMNVTQEQRYLYARTLRHLRTAESTLWRTFWYYLAIYGTICLASFSQLVVVRMMFRKSRKQGLII